MSEIIVSGALQMSETNTPTRAGELVQNVAEIYDIVNPRVGMVVYVAAEGKNYVITQLKEAEIGGVMVPNAAVKSYELLDKHAIDRIKGVASDSNPLTDPFKFLGNYEGSMQDLWDTLDDFTGDNKAGCEGYFRARNGNSIIEIVSYPVSYKDNYWLQIVKGKLKVDNNGAIVSSTNFNILSRIHNYKVAGWSNWEVIAGGDLKAEIVEDIEGLSGAITSEETRAKGAEQALERAINSEISRAKTVEQELTNRINTLIGGVPDDTLDTIQEIADWLLNDKTGTQAIINKIAAEEKRALAAELVLQEEIDGNFANLSDSIQDVTDDIRTEVARAKEAEAALQNNISKNATDIASTSKKADAAVTLALRKLFVAAGAVYNDTNADISRTAPWGETVTHKAGHYYLNGLGDITEDEMIVIYNKGNTLNLGYNLYAYEGRTNLPLLSIGTTTNLEGYYYAYNCSSEVINLSTGNGSLITFKNTSATERSFANCNKLKAVCERLTFGDLLPSVNIFYNSKLLQFVNIYKLKHDFSFATNSIISKESILYMIKNATPTSAITITLHHNAYVRLTSDQEVLDALTEKNEALAVEGGGGKISLVCATDSEEITPNA